MGSRTRSVVRHVPVPGKAAARDYWQDVLQELPPEPPTTPYEGPEPPEWMKAPETVLDVRGTPVEWVDAAPMDSWRTRLGKAAFELVKLDGSASAEEQKAADGLPPWAPDPTDRRTPLSVLNHPSERLSVAERAAAKHGKADAAWLPVPPERQLPVVEVYSTPLWWDE
ncbi:hypothetical protein [Streptomyces sp. NPDC090112]|uniref:hypothetical protein n=1 Tax=Streptomyces sp. NPDC090112 TaxID=3365949 RepID=UPI0038308FA0